VDCQTTRRIIIEQYSVLATPSALIDDIIEEGKVLQFRGVDEIANNSTSLKVTSVSSGGRINCDINNSTKV
jgi:hypothetical protein